MAGPASWVSSRALRVATAATVTLLLSGCTGSSGPPVMAPMKVPVAKKRHAPAHQGLAYRRKGGQALYPVVVADDPPPAAAPAAGHPAGQSGTLNGNPNGITRDTLNRSIQGAMGALAACFVNITHDPMVAVSFEADPSGRPSLVRVSGAPPDAERCIRGVVQGIRFPGFEGKGVQVDLPLSFHRARPAAVTQAPQPGQETAPPLFLEP